MPLFCASCKTRLGELGPARSFLGEEWGTVNLEVPAAYNRESDEWYCGACEPPEPGPEVAEAA